MDITICPRCQLVVEAPLLRLARGENSRMTHQEEVLDEICERCYSIVSGDRSSAGFGIGRPPGLQPRGGSLSKTAQSPGEIGIAFDLLPVRLRANADPRFTGKGITIAFIDSGFFPHPDLMEPRRRVLKFVDVTDDRYRLRDFRVPHDESWHGTMTSVIASGNGWLSEGRHRGIASGSNLVLIKVMHSAERRVSEKDIARGIRWAIAHRKRYDIRIINIAVGADEPERLEDSDVDQAVEDAVASGLLVISAAGNNPGGPVVPPASAPSALTIGGVDDGNRMDHDPVFHGSTWGRTLNGHEKPEIYALATKIPGPILPGTNQFRESHLLFRMFSLHPKAALRLLKKNQAIFPRSGSKITVGRLNRWIRKRIATMKYVSPYHKNMEGTSTAAAIVSSVVAQLFEVNPLLKPSEIRSILAETASPLKNLPNGHRECGLLNPRAAIEKALLSRHPVVEPGVHRLGPYLCFLCDPGPARTLSIAGNFNGWQPTSTPCHRLSCGLWSCLMPSPANGSVTYKLVIDGERWTPDPSNSHREPDGFGGWNSVIPAYV
jgi:serine protease AprX